MGRFRFVFAALIGGFATAALADEAPIATGPWSGTAGAGYLATSGNSDSSSGNVKLGLAYDADKWHDTFGATATLASQDNQDTAEAYTANAESRYDFATRYYGFGSANWIHDRFSGYVNQLYEAAGLGWHAILPPAHRLDLEAGPGFRQARLRDNPDTPDNEGQSQNEMIGIARATYEWALSENATFLEKASVVYGSDNTLYESISSLKAGLVGNVSLVLGYTVRHNTDVEPGFDKTDTTTTITLEYAFGKKK